MLKLDRFAKHGDGAITVDKLSNESRRKHMPEYSTILFAVSDKVAHLTFNRPESANSLNATLSAELMDAVARCEDDPDVRALVVSGSGRFFCAGADLKGFYSAGSELKSRVSLFHVSISRLARADFPVIAAVNGAAAGAGMGLACACDLVIAAESARFTMAYTKIGLSPDGTTTYFLPRRIGIGRAMELVLLNRTLSAKEALDWGIANRVVADATLAEEAHALAAQLAKGPTRAYGAAKRLMHSGFTESLETQIEMELRSVGALARTEDARAAIAAFAAKRAPVFTGR
jgi:2-(1,2-epoxy-1,2-dihydrophenyl)acetyl-CoA isomerase